MKDLQNIKFSFFILFLGFTLSLWSKPLEKVEDTLPTTSQRQVYFFEDCDVCGCSGNGGSMGYGGNLTDNFIGVRYLKQSYKSRDGIFNNSPWVDENFNTLQLWSKIPVTEKISVHAIVPYHFHDREFGDNSTQKINGIGDISVLAFYKLIQTNKDSLILNPDKLAHTLRVGGGVKAPTGNYEKDNNAGSVNPSFQVGTGSWDYTVGLDYNLGYRTYGANVLLNYTFKTENDLNYHFGNQTNYGLSFFGSFNSQNAVSISPSLGIAGEIFEENEQYGEAVVNTKGDVLFSQLGIHTTYKKWSVGANVMLPIHQNLNSGLVEVNYRTAVYVNFSI